MTYLCLRHVAKDYAANGQVIQALRDVNLAVEQNEFVVLLGPSGCGKSTLLQIVAGLTHPTAGEVLLAGQAITHWGAERTLIFQKPNLFPWLTAEDNVAFGLHMAGYRTHERQRLARAALERLGLAAVTGLYPHELSGGMQQRVALARALVLRPAVLLMDEPLAAVDAWLRAQLQNEMRTACRGVTVLYVTHNILEALILADRVVLLTPRPGRVARELRLTGTAPRPLTPELAGLEQQLQAEWRPG